MYAVRQMAVQRCNALISVNSLGLVLPRLANSKLGLRTSGESLTNLDSWGPRTKQLLSPCMTEHCPLGCDMVV